MAHRTKQERRAAKRRRHVNAKKSKQPPREPMPKEFTLYCDEAGNTGINYLDPAQPVHVIAGWVVPKEREQQWATEIASLRAQQRAPELHGVTLLKSSKGRKLAAKILEAGLRNGCLPTSLVAFKGHCLSLRAVETFLDPMLNPGAVWLPSGANETRRGIATLLWQEVPDAVREFGACFKTPDRSTWTAAVTGIANALDAANVTSRNGTLVSNLVRSLRQALVPEVMDEIIDSERRTVWGTGKRYEAMSLNFPVFLNFMRNLDMLMHGAVLDVIHDETLQFEAVFRQGVELFGKLGRIDVRVEDGTAWRLSAGSYRSFTTRDSKDVIGLQAADIMAASVFRVAKRAHDDEPLTNEEEPLAALALGHEAALTVTGDFPRAPGMGSGAELTRLHLRAFQAAQRYYKTGAQTGGSS
ncbi:DUF3800 domain-containing protein [Enhygromyxa salina]|uniref:DUF3800 domain-containing protein n=1 Tax=Enhygromyxa salina TaxID=215803 RepID=A0A2S9YUI2_9BACT|nr:DUF3800 domain-containing protein [Enhygromyxa salina]PRQ08744.1 hypothetical protein ENSA7_15620 [Enhygromyxa salina]